MRTFLSVYDKTGVVELAQALVDATGSDLLSSGGTATALREAGLTVTSTEDLTGFPAILSHRVVTLHPKVHGGLLADPTDPDHQADMAEHGIQPIDLLVSNLYPFGSAIEDFEHGGKSPLDTVDIGGPAMVRAAAKNHAHVAVVTDPSDYSKIIDEIRADGALSAATRRRLAIKAFTTTSAYDAAVVKFLVENPEAA